MSSSTASILLSSAVLLPSQSVYHFLPGGCYPGRTVSYSGLLMTLGKPPTRSCFQNPPRTSILFCSSPSRVSILLLAFFTFTKTLNSYYFKAVTETPDSSSLTNSRPSTVLAWSVCLALVPENQPQHT